MLLSGSEVKVLATSVIFQEKLKFRMEPECLPRQKSDKNFKINFIITMNPWL
jgi:hypothetical protein